MKPAHRIPLGVEDPDAGVACIAIPGAVEMIELATGRVVWHLDEPLIPLAMDDQRVLVRRRDREPYILILELRSRRDARLITRSEPVSLPFNADLDALNVSVDEGAFVVQWIAPSEYRGGAPITSSNVESRAPTTGALRVEGDGHIAPAPIAFMDKSTSRSSQVVLSMTDDVLQARDATTDHVLWQRAAGARPTRRSPPLRP